MCCTPTTSCKSATTAEAPEDTSPGLTAAAAAAAAAHGLGAETRDTRTRGASSSGARISSEEAGAPACRRASSARDARHRSSTRCVCRRVERAPAAMASTSSRSRSPDLQSRGAERVTRRSSRRRSSGRSVEPAGVRSAQCSGETAARASELCAPDVERSERKTALGSCGAGNHRAVEFSGRREHLDGVRADAGQAQPPQAAEDGAGELRGAHGSVSLAAAGRKEKLSLFRRPSSTHLSSKKNASTGQSCDKPLLRSSSRRVRAGTPPSPSRVRATPPTAASRRGPHGRTRATRLTAAQTAPSASANTAMTARARAPLPRVAASRAPSPRPTAKRATGSRTDAPSAARAATAPRTTSGTAASASSLRA